MAQRLNAPDEIGVLHYVTCNVRERKRAFHRPEYAQLVLEQLRFECDRHPAVLVAYVAMPDHLHFLIGLQDGALKRFLARFKPNTTRNLDALARAQGRDKVINWLAAKGPRELWQDSKYSLHIYSPAWIEEKTRYIHENPVRAGMVEGPGDYPWSSFGAYFPELGVVPPVKVDVDWERIVESWGKTGRG